MKLFFSTSDNLVALAAIYLPSPTNEKSQILHRKNDEILGKDRLHDLLAEVFPEVFGRVLQRLEDPRNIEEIFGTVCDNSQNLVYPGLSLKKFENFAAEMTNRVKVTDTKGFWTILCELNSDTFQKLFSELCRPLLKSQQELNPESVITSLHGIYVILETLSREFEVNRKGLEQKLQYVTWFVLNTFIHVLRITPENENIVKMCTKIIPNLLYFVQNSDDWTGEDKIMSKLILPLTNVLIDNFLKFEHTSISQEILETLKILVLNNKDKLSKNNFIRLIGPFPKDRNCFDVLKAATSGQICINMEDKNESMSLEKSLIDEMTDFVSKIEPRKETVEILLNKLVESTSEVTKLLKDLSKISTTEEANNSLLHKTVRSLINLSKNQNIQTGVKLGLF
jgi:hypothetical protein